MGRSEDAPNRCQKLWLLIGVLALSSLPQPEAGWGQERKPSPAPLRLGYSAKFLNEVSKADAQAALEMWVGELDRNARSVRIEPRPRVYDDISSMTAELAGRELDIIALTILDYLIVREKVPLDPVLVGNRGNSIGGDEMLLLVRSDQGITDIGQLQGKRLIVHSGIVLEHARLWLDTILAKWNLPRWDKFFGSVKESSTSSGAALPVFFKQAEAAIVIRGSFEMMIALNPQLGKQLTALASSEKLLYGVICLRMDLDPDVKAEVVDSALQVERSPAGKQIMTLFRLESITRFKPSYLETTLDLLREYNKLNRRRQ